MEDQRRKVDVAARVREYLLDEFDGGTFKLSDLRRELGFNEKQYALARQVIRRMVGNELQKHGHQLGVYRVVDRKKEPIDWSEDTSSDDCPLVLPGGAHKVSKPRYGDMIDWAAYKNHTKTAIACAHVRPNLNDFEIHFFMTEYPARMKKRFLDFGIPLDHPNFKAYQLEKSDYIPDKVEPGRGVLNIIDHYPNVDNFYLVGKIQDEIHRALNGAICIITHQKKRPEDLDAIGGSFWLSTPTLAVTIFGDEPGEYPWRMMIRKGKEPGPGYTDVNNLSLKYKLIGGCRFEYDPEGWKLIK
jgi:hypothetical protein